MLIYRKKSVHYHHSRNSRMIDDLIQAGRQADFCFFFFETKNSNLELICIHKNLSGMSNNNN